MQSLHFTSIFEKHDLEENFWRKNSKKHEFDCKIFSKKQDFEWKNFVESVNFK